MASSLSWRRLGNAPLCGWAQVDRVIYAEVDWLNEVGGIGCLNRIWASDKLRRDSIIVITRYGMIDNIPLRRIKRILKYN